MFLRTCEWVLVILQEDAGMAAGSSGLGVTVLGTLKAKIMLSLKFVSFCFSCFRQGREKK